MKLYDIELNEYNIPHKVDIAEWMATGNYYNDKKEAEEAAKAKAETQKEAEEAAKAKAREALVARATELGLEFAPNLGDKKLSALIEEAEKALDNK